MIMNSKISEKMAMLEAALYSAGRPVDLQNLKKVIRTTSDKTISNLLRDLAIKYEARRSALEVRLLPGDRAVMRLRDRYDATVKRFTNRPLLSSGPLKTLSYVAYHQPVEQTKVVSDRGSHVYSHLKKMEELGLINRSRYNNSFMIETTPYFSEYFGFGHDPMKSKIQLREIFNDLQIKRIDNGDKEDASSELLRDAFSDGPLGNSLDGFL